MRLKVHSSYAEISMGKYFSTKIVLDVLKYWISIIRLSVNDKEDAAIKHAIAVRAAVAAGNYTTFFRLYKTAPNLGTCLMGMSVHWKPSISLHE